MKKFVLILAVSFCICVSYAEPYSEYLSLGHWFGVVKNNTVECFEYENNSWQVVPTRTMKLPIGYSKVFSLGNWLGIVKT
jgi:hypothetical protein